jgi:hypothetical protein
MIKVGDIIKAQGQGVFSSHEDYGYVAKEDHKYFWVYWFDDPDSTERNYLFKYNKEHDDKTFQKVS